MLAHFGDEVGRCTLTADSSGAVHQHLLVSEEVQVLINIIREITEFTDVWGQAMCELPLGGQENHILAAMDYCLISKIGTEQSLDLQFYSRKSCGSLRGWCRRESHPEPLKLPLLYGTPLAPDELLQG